MDGIVPALRVMAAPVICRLTYMNGIRRGGDGDLAAGDTQAVVCGDAVLIGGR